MSKLDKYNDIINKTALTAAGFGVPGAFVPWLDVGSVSACWITMTMMIAEKAGHQVDEKSVGKFIVTIVEGAAAYMIGSKVLTALLNLIPVAGTGTAISLNAALNWLYTIRLGRALAKRFDNRNFDMEDLAGMAVTIQAMVFVVPSLGELKQAFSAISSNG